MAADYKDVEDLVGKLYFNGSLPTLETDKDRVAAFQVIKNIINSPDLITWLEKRAIDLRRSRKFPDQEINGTLESFQNFLMKKMEKKLAFEKAIREREASYKTLLKTIPGYENVNENDGNTVAPMYHPYPMPYKYYPPTVPKHHHERLGVFPYEKFDSDFNLIESKTRFNPKEDLKQRKTSRRILKHDSDQEKVSQETETNKYSKHSYSMNNMNEGRMTNAPDVKAQPVNNIWPPQYASYPQNVNPNQYNYGPEQYNAPQNPSNFGPDNLGQNQNGFNQNQNNHYQNQNGFSQNQNNHYQNQNGFSQNQNNYYQNHNGFSQNQYNPAMNQANLQHDQYNNQHYYNPPYVGQK